MGGLGEGFDESNGVEVAIDRGARLFSLRLDPFCKTRLKFSCTSRLELLASLPVVLKALAIFKVSFIFNSAAGLGASTALLSRVSTVEGEASSCSGLGSALSRRRI